ncbi:MAG TPA: D-glycero-beta-D-manno-heptose-7-phosphate kinase, partial [Solirubrobacteraceae bacterium]|nr:D-glycero-beta-D-manno-heptose-7-phosphate kinase [Solirubrobacteraceae bacterium]
EYLWGQVQRISPEAPVPVVEVRRRTHVPGGAANAAAGVAALDGRALLGGVVGDDAAAAALRESLAALGVQPDGLVVDPDRPTTVKTRVVAHAQQVVRTDSETRDDVSARVEEQLVEWVRGAVAGADAVIVSDYRKGVVSQTLAAAAIAAASAAGKPVVVDSKGLEYAKYRGATVITPNVHDAGLAANVHVETDDDLRRAADRLTELCGGAALLITRGAAGMTLFGAGEPVHVPTQAQEVFDVTGAGDTVVAVLAVALGRGRPLPEAVRLANAAAGVVVGKVGTSTVTLDELERAVA